MARLYLSHTTDKGNIDGSNSHCANEFIRAAIYWGSKSSSKLAVELWVVWEKDKKEPTVHFIATPNGEFIQGPVITNPVEERVSRWKQK